MIVAIIGLNAADPQIFLFILYPVTASTGADRLFPQETELFKFVDRQIVVVNTGHFCLALGCRQKYHAQVLAATGAPDAGADARKTPGRHGDQNTDDRNNDHQFDQSKAPGLSDGADTFNICTHKFCKDDNLNLSEFKAAKISRCRNSRAVI